MDVRWGKPFTIDDAPAAAAEYLLLLQSPTISFKLLIHDLLIRIKEFTSLEPRNVSSLIPTTSRPSEYWVLNWMLEVLAPLLISHLIDELQCAYSLIALLSTAPKYWYHNNLSLTLPTALSRQHMIPISNHPSKSWNTSSPSSKRRDMQTNRGQGLPFSHGTHGAAGNEERTRAVVWIKDVLNLDLEEVDMSVGRLIIIQSVESVLWWTYDSMWRSRKVRYNQCLGWLWCRRTLWRHNLQHSALEVVFYSVGIWTLHTLHFSIK